MGIEALHFHIRNVMLCVEHTSVDLLRTKLAIYSISRPRL